MNTTDESGTAAQATSSPSNMARGQLIEWVGKAAPVIASGIGFAGFVALLGAGVVWMRFDAAQLPASHALAKFPQTDLIGTGAVTLVLFLVLGALAVLLVYLLQSLGPTQTGDRERRERAEELEEALQSARDRLAPIESDLAGTKDDPPIGGTDALKRLRSEALSAVEAVETDLLEAEAEDRVREETERANRTQTPTTGNELGLIALLVVEAVIVIWTSNAATVEQIAFTIVAAGAALLFSVIGSVTAVGRARPDTLFVARGPVEEHEEKPKGAVKWSLAQFVLVITPVAFSALLIDTWFFIPIGVALLLAVGNLLIGRLHPRRFFWYGCSIFASVALFGAALTYSRIQRDPSMEPTAVLLHNGRTFAGLYVTETRDRIYLARVEVGSNKKPLKDSGRIFWISRKKVRTVSVGSLQPIAKANERSAELKAELATVP